MRTEFGSDHSFMCGRRSWTSDSVFENFKMGEAINGNGRENGVFGSSKLKVVLASAFATL
jgi:hypothetical protein